MYVVISSSGFKFLLTLKIVMLVIAWHMKAKRMGYFTRSEWMEGLQELQ